MKHSWLYINNPVYENLWISLNNHAQYWCGVSIKKPIYNGLMNIVGLLWNLLDMNLNIE